MSDTEELFSDEDSLGPTFPPPPPNYPHPEDVAVIGGAEDPSGDAFLNEYYEDSTDDDGEREIESRGEDPPQEIDRLVTDYNNNNDDDDDVDYEMLQYQSVEIPPTHVVQRMLMQEKHRTRDIKQQDNPSRDLKQQDNQSRDIMQQDNQSRDLKQQDNLSRVRKQRGGNQNLAVLAIGCCVIVTLIILIIGFTTDMFKNETTSVMSLGDEVEGPQDTTDPPAPSPTVDGERAERVRTYIREISLDPEGFNQVNSPQSLALIYLSGSVPLGLDPDLPQDRLRLKQKFALLAGLWYPSQFDWTNSAGWATDDDECTWFGVRCSNTTVQNTTFLAVSSISLGENNVQGVSEEIGLLNSMVSIDLNSNVIVGTVPASIAQLDQLESLFLFNNSFQDEWPSDLSGLSSLSTLYASNNQFTDDVAKFFVISSLKILILDDNRLVGTLDGVSALANLGKTKISLLTSESFPKTA